MTLTEALSHPGLIITLVCAVIVAIGDWREHRKK